MGFGSYLEDILDALGERMRKKSKNDNETIEPNNDGLDFDEAQHTEFWSDFNEYLSEKSALKSFGGLNQNNLFDNLGKVSYFGCDVGLYTFKTEGKRSIWLAGSLNPTYGVGAAITIDREMSQIFDILKSHSDKIELHFKPGETLEWTTTGRFLRVGFTRTTFLESEDESHRQELFQWLQDKFENLERVYLSIMTLHLYESVKSFSKSF